MTVRGDPPVKAGKPRIRASAVCVDRAHLLCVRLRDPVTGISRWFLPGGAVEPGETPAQAAARETLEETGYRVEIEPTSERVLRYPFEWSGVAFDVTTHFFRAQLTEPLAQPAEVNDAVYHEGFAWLPVSELEAAIGFHEGIYGTVLSML